MNLLTSKEMEEWYDVVEPIHKRWIKKDGGQGPSGRKSI
jgi:hypothetical protein